MPAVLPAPFQESGSLNGVNPSLQILTIQVKGVVAVGTLTSSPKHIFLPASFPVGELRRCRLAVYLGFSLGPLQAAFLPPLLCHSHIPKFSLTVPF